MSDQDKAMDLIRDEMAKNHDRPEIVLLGEYLTERLKTEPGIAEALLKMKTPLNAGFEAIRDHARKIAKGGYACVDDKTGFGIACKRWGIDPSAAEGGDTPPSDPRTPPLTGEAQHAQALARDALDLDALLEFGV